MSIDVDPHVRSRAYRRYGYAIVVHVVLALAGALILAYTDGQQVGQAYLALWSVALIPGAGIGWWRMQRRLRRMALQEAIRRQNWPANRLVEERIEPTLSGPAARSGGSPRTGAHQRPETPSEQATTMRRACNG